ncbi:hypothetical protein [Flavobacterium commune]|uniref:Uncharacterized protein n=1 Tax=Flavobacterium commune TaxID=1306519 RepID=A0A1D9PBW9_9FLAO|nr:hypothetical protein [Flavobacterium commune]AOZ99615.1 hypothetical protein BIW12_09265 [Flavobacterium commune]
MDFNKETQIAIAKVVSEKMPEMIEAQATEMVENIVSNIFRWGDTKDKIKKKIEESINVNLQEFDLIDYNALIAKVINDNLLEQVNLQPILDMTQDIIGFVKQKEITLQGIANMFIEASQEENSSDYSGEITFIVKERTEHNWCEIYADIEPDKEENKCSIKFIISTRDSRDGQIFSLKTKEKYFGEKQEEITPSKLVAMRGIEAKIFRLYSAQVKITNYDQEINNYWDRD